MIKVEHIETYGFEAAIRGMRNPMNSWEKSDSFVCNNTLDSKCKNCHFIDPENNGDDGCTMICLNYNEFSYIVGANDMDLMQRLYKGGKEHRKFMRQIFVSMDISAPLYWWKEFDTYKVGTTANSCSTMHKIHSKEFTIEDFSHEHLEPDSVRILGAVIEKLNKKRKAFLQLDGGFITAESKKHEWWQMIQLLPTSYNQKRTVTMTYENAVAMIKQRSGHKLDEWREFVEILKRLPYIAQIIGGCTAEK